MDFWYLAFLGCLLFLLLFSTQRDRASLLIVTVSNIIGLLLVIFVTRQIHAPWKLAIPGAGETLTILALIGVARNRTAYFQAILLLIAWCAHLLCYVDCETGSNLVYDHYEQILGGVAVLQILGFHDTWFSIGRAIQRGFHLWATGGGFVSPASGSSAMVRTPVDAAK